MLQVLNGEPTFFLSADDYINTTINGSFGVEELGNFDDDFIGFTFGYQNTSNYYLFDWKQNAKWDAIDGFRLSKITGTDVNFWGHTGSDIEILATDSGGPGNDRGWADNTFYDFSLTFTETGLTVSIDGEQIFAESGTFTAGKFGLYNYSQAHVRYSGLSEVTAPPITPSSNPPVSTVPVPGALYLLGSGITGLLLLRRKKK